MTPEQQATFIRELCDAVERDLYLEAIRGKLPEEWDGIELRRLIADRFQQAVIGSMSRARQRAYKNEVLIRNL